MELKHCARSVRFGTHLVFQDRVCSLRKYAQLVLSFCVTKDEADESSKHQEKFRNSLFAQSRGGNENLAHGSEHQREAERSELVSLLQDCGAESVSHLR